MALTQTYCSKQELQTLKMISKKFPFLFFFFFFFITNFLSTRSYAHDDQTTIVFTTIGKPRYAFDIYTLPIAASINPLDEIKLTDGSSVNFNGHFPSSSSSTSLLDSLQSNHTLHLIYVTERNGSSSVYLDSVHAIEYTRSQVCLAGCEGRLDTVRVSMKDRPSLVGDILVYVSTHEDSGVGRTSWTAVYSTLLSSGVTRRLTPYGVADYSPAVSPSGVWTAVASYGEKGWAGEVEELSTDIYVFLTRDGSNRVKVVEHGGWPSWADDSSFYFHRKASDGWWSVYKAILPDNGQLNVHSVVTHRVTPPGLHSFTPAASLADKSFIAVATRRRDSKFRHIEIFDVVAKSFKPLTLLISPQSHHLNPFISPDSSRVGYHSCRGRKTNNLFMENIKSVRPGTSLLSIDGDSPSFSPDGSRIIYVGTPGLFVVNNDGSGHREVLSKSVFSTAWDAKRKGVVYTSVGPPFASVRTDVDIISLNVDDEEPSYKKLTHGGENNAFPCSSPDGKWIAFRSGRTGYKNLYIMDAVDGERGSLLQLTEGSWIDTMCNWSPDGDWIAFSSDRDNPGSGSFSLFMIHPNGTGLRKLVQSGTGGRVNHPWFSPDSKEIVFTSDYAAVSAEPISNPHHFGPYGEIFTMKLDGSDLTRLTHNSFEDGTPCWGPKYVKPIDVEWPSAKPKCSFEDCHWLNIKSLKLNHSTEISALGSNRIQCGGEDKRPASCCASAI